MTAYTTLSDTDLQAGKPLTQAKARALRDNPIAITEGSSGAPKMQTAGIADDAITPAKLSHVAADTSSSIICGGFNGALIATGQTPTKVVEFISPKDGTYRIDFDLRETPQTGGLAYARVYRNGSAVGTQFSDEGDAVPTGCNEAVSGWQAGDLLQVYLYHDAVAGGSEVTNLTIYADEFVYVPLNPMFTPVT